MMMDLLRQRPRTRARRRAGLVLWCAWILWTWQAPNPRLRDDPGRYRAVDAFSSQLDCNHHRGQMWLSYKQLGQPAPEGAVCLPDTVRP
jgi:hypothetical protein